MKRPRKAMILAAGYGTRLRPLTDACPKPLVPVWGRPALDLILDQLAAWGVRDVMINLHHRPWDILLHLVHEPRDDLRIHFSFEPGILGTGGGLKKVEWFFDDGPFWLVNADIIADLNPAPLIRAFDPRRMLAMAWLDATRGPRSVEMKRGYITHFRHPQPGAPGTCTFCGLHLLTRRIFEYLPEVGFAGIVEAYERALRDGRRIGGLTVPNALWSDIGTPGEYLEAHRRLAERHRGTSTRIGKLIRSANRRAMRLLEGGATIRGMVVAGEQVTTGRGAVIRDAIVMDGASFASDARVEGAVIGPGAHAGGPVHHMAVRAYDSLTAGEHESLLRMGWHPDRATMVVLPPRGSARSYYRLIEGRKRCVLMRYDPARKENTFYARHTEFLLDGGIPVPRILDRVDAEHVLFIEDAGDVSLQDIPVSRRRAVYERVLRHVAEWHVTGAGRARQERLPLMKPFGPELFRAEHELFLDLYVASYIKADERLVRRIRRELGRVAERLERTRPVLVHRDLQSSNILWSRGEPVFIDFQGMRYGPAAYDLASLLCDPYVELSESLCGQLVSRYAAHMPASVFREEDFWPAAVQRLAQAMGAYVRLSRTPGCQRFLDYIPPARRMLLRALRQVGHLPVLEGLLDRSGD